MKDKIIALLLAFVMAFTAVPTAFAADDDGHDHDHEGTEFFEKTPVDGEIVVNEEDTGALEWVLDHLGTLHIGGYGKIKPFTSADDQPWKDYRDRIFDVDIHFDEIEIENTDYWFDGCAFMLQAVSTMSLMSVSGTAPLLAASSGGHACAIGTCTCTGRCSSGYTDYTAIDSTSHEMRPYCTGCGACADAYVVGSHTFRGNTCSLCGYTKACTHRTTRTEYITSCIWQNVCTSCGEVISSGTSHGPYTYGSWSYDNASTHSRTYTCSHGDSGTYYESAYHDATPTYAQYNATQHSVSSYCYACSHAVGTTSYENHTFTYGSWQNYSATQHRRAVTCSKCGYTSYEYASHSLTYGSWTSKSATQHQRAKTCSCGYSGTETASHSFTYGSWQNYNATQHRRTRTCSTCGYSDYEYQNHSIKTGKLASISDTQHKHTDTCSCGYSTTVKENHNLTYGSWTSKSATQHQRAKTCSCGYSGTETASHSFTYGSWENYNATQHRRTRTCATCGYSDYEYQNHSIKTGKLTSISDTQHKHTDTCSCGYSTTVKENHSITYGSWTSKTATQHQRTKSCSCGYSGTETANHSFTYGSWQSYDGSQHRRTRTCSTCGFSDYEYQNHTLKTGASSSISDTQHKHTDTCSCGYSITVTEDHKLTYGAWASENDAQHRRSKSCACGYSGSEVAGHRDSGGDGYCDDCGYEMIRFSVTVPSSLSLTVSRDGTVYSAENAAIVNRSTGAVRVTGITASAANGWTLVPYSTNMAKEKVDSKRIGFCVNGAATAKSGASEALALGGGWTIAKGASLPLSYHAAVSATSEAIPVQQVMTLVFVVDWA